MTIPEQQSLAESVNPTQKFLDFFSDQSNSFDSVMTTSEKQSNFSNFFHLEGVRYKFDDQNIETIVNHESNEIHNDQFADDDLTKFKEESQELLHSAPVFLNISPTPATSFLAQLPQHLTSFINYFVDIIKQYTSINGEATEIRAKFASMNLDIVFSNNHLDQSMKIKLFLGSDSLIDLMKLNEDKLHLFLEHKLDRDIDLELVFESFEESNLNQNDSNNDNSDQPEQEKPEEESDDILG